MTSQLCCTLHVVGTAQLLAELCIPLGCLHHTVGSWSGDQCYFSILVSSKFKAETVFSGCC